MIFSAQTLKSQTIHIDQVEHQNVQIQPEITIGRQFVLSLVRGFGWGTGLTTSSYLAYKVCEVAAATINGFIYGASSGAVTGSELSVILGPQFMIAGSVFGGAAGGVVGGIAGATVAVFV